jgi:hypothetical protein
VFCRIVRVVSKNPSDQVVTDNGDCTGDIKSNQKNEDRGNCNLTFHQKSSGY